MADHTLLSFGHGYSARVFARGLQDDGWSVLGTTRKADRIDELAASGATPILWPGDTAAIGAALANVDHILISAAPGEDGDPVLRDWRDDIVARAGQLTWVGYLSTTGVYGDRQGGWVDESSVRRPGTRRGQWRAAAEDAWLELFLKHNIPVHVFRLAGIYGPDRGPFAKVREGTARRIVKPGQVFSRIHVEDISATLRGSLLRPNPGAVYNVCDDDPAPPQDVIEHAARLLGMAVPEAVSFETADMTPMARSFYSESKRVSNARMKTELHVSLRYPGYREGLASILNEIEA